MAAVEAAGFIAAFGPRAGRVDRRSPLFDLPRVQVDAGDGGWRFGLKIAAPGTYAWCIRAGDSAARRLRRLPGMAGRGR